MRLARRGLSVWLMGVFVSCSSGCSSGKPAVAAAPARSVCASGAAAGDAPKPVIFTDFTALAERVARGVVRVVVTRPRASDPGTEGSPSEGSGVVLSRDGMVVTNAHVVHAATRVDVVAPDGRLLGAAVVAADEPSDLAVLRLQGDLAGLEPLSWAREGVVRAGAPVLSVGNSLGTGITVSAGIVASTGRSGLGHARYEDFIVTDARISRGTSGGALVDAEGDLVGIGTGILVDGRAGAAFGLAISARLARPVVEQLASGRPVSRGDIGLDVDDIDPARAREGGLSSADGAMVTTVDPGGPAVRAGLVRGDVIVEANGWAVARRGQLRAALSLVDSGHEVAVVVMRGGKRITVRLVPGSSPAPEPHASPDVATTTPAREPRRR